jgi:hypothetical protein
MGSAEHHGGPRRVEQQNLAIRLTGARKWPSQLGHHGGGPAVPGQSDLRTDPAVDPGATATDQAGTGTGLGSTVHRRAQLVDVNPADTFDA